MITNSKGDAISSINDLQYGYLRDGLLSFTIKDSSNYKIKLEPALDINFWRQEKRRCIEGRWIYDGDGYFYVVPNLHFFLNHCSIERVKPITSEFYPGRPELWDLTILYSLLSMESKGFSGWMDDPLRTGCYDVMVFNKDQIPPSKLKYLLKPDGKFKDFVHPWELLNSKHEASYGLPLYFNSMSNVGIFGSRGGGKTVYTAGAEMFFEIVTDGAKYYTPPTDPDFKQTYSVVGIGSADAKKSTGICDKVVYMMNALSTDESLGVIGKPGEVLYEPSPLFKNMDNSTSATSSKPWISPHSGSRLHHYNFSSTKAHGLGATAAASQRFQIIVVEEFGLSSNIVSIFGSNEYTVKLGSTTVGRQWMMGTSEIDEIVENGARIIFENPADFRMLSFKHPSKNKANIFYLPTTLVDPEFKDDHGNTNIEDAAEYYSKLHESKRNLADPDIYVKAKKSQPIEPEDMWVSFSSNVLPSSAANLTLRDLRFKGLPVELIRKADLQVTYDIIDKAHAILDWPFLTKAGSSKTGGCPIIYHPPPANLSTFPSDALIAVFDPYVAEGIDEGGSIGSFYIITSHKYEFLGLPPMKILASYNAKPEQGLSYYYDNIINLLLLYGGAKGMCVVERQAGHTFKKHLSDAGFEYLLKPGIRAIDTQGGGTPPWGVSITKSNKPTLLTKFADMLRSPVGSSEDSASWVTTLECPFLLKQIAMGTDRHNLDAVSAMLIYVATVMADKTTSKSSIKKMKLKTAFQRHVDSVLSNRYNKR